MFREHGPDAVVIAFSMPVMNGLEARREISRINPQYSSPDVHYVQIAATRERGSEGWR
jgi:CheY-like chemotaxis protein